MASFSWRRLVASLTSFRPHVSAPLELRILYTFAAFSELHAGLEDGNDGVVDVILRVQDHHVRNPPDIPDLLFPQLHPGIEDAEVVLLLEGHLIHVHVLLSS